MKTAIYPGTFDPVTLGHLDIIERAAAIFGRVVVTVARNPKKTPLFTAEERVAMIREVTTHLANVTCESFDGLVVDFARQAGAQALIRGLRAVSDFEYELQMAHVNRRLHSQLVTVVLMPGEKFTYLNSTIVKEVAAFGGDIAAFVSPSVMARLHAKLAGQK